MAGDAPGTRPARPTTNHGRKGDAARRRGDTVRFVLLEDRPAGLGFGQFVRARDLSAYQVRSGLGALKDEAAGRR
ncbi:hypothetical protein GCM10010221_51270 [Streptomyces parvus]|nr:hypothetical protein GCM10010221_51270 [Streptomyces parvus]